jgi:hypothetical protein
MQQWVGSLHNFVPFILNLHLYILVQRVNATDVCKKLMGPEIIFVVQSTLDCVCPFCGGVLERRHGVSSSSIHIV